MNTSSCRSSSGSSGFTPATVMASASHRTLGLGATLPLQHTLAVRVAVTLGAIAFAALLAHLPHLVLPIALLGGLSLLRSARVCAWQTRMWTQLQQSLKLSALSAPTHTEPSTAEPVSRKHETQSQTTTAANHGAAPSHASVSPVPIGVPAPTVKRRSKLAVPRSLTPSLRVTDLGVDADGAPLRLDAPRELLGDFVVEPNSAAPYEFENDFVKGKLLFLLNRQDGVAVPAAVEPFFEGKRRLFWVQMQLQFKRAPSGIVYIGGEVPRAMHLGFFTGGLTKIILSVLQSLVRGLHYGFGRLVGAANSAVATRDDEELPHICFPLYTAVDQFVCTPLGVEPPALGSMDFGESKDAALARRKSGDAFYKYSTTATYSFHFHSYFIDFSRWKLQNVPGMRDVDLSAFWSDMPLQLVAYSLKAPASSSSLSAVGATSDSDAKKAIHSRRAKEYKFCFELSHRVQDPIADDDRASRSESSDVVLTDEQAQLEVLGRELARYDFSVPAWFEYYSTSAMHSERRVGYALRVREYTDGHGDASASSTLSSPATPRRRVKSEYTVLHTALVAHAPLAFLEHELSAARKRSLFASKTREASISVRARSNKYSKVDDERQFLEFHLQQLARRAGATAARPSQLFAAQSALLDLLQHKCTSLHGEWPFLASLLGGSGPSPLSSSSSSSDVLVSPSPTGSPSPGGSPMEIKGAPHAAVQVVRVVTAHRWRHEWITLDRTARVLRFFRMMTSSHSFAIALDDVLTVAIDSDDSSEPLASTDADAATLVYWLHVGTLDKCHHIAFSSRLEREQWRASIAETANGPSARAMATRLEQSIIESSARLSLEAFASDSASSSASAAAAAKMRGRFVLNARCDLATHATARARALDPNAIVAQCLKQVLALQTQRLQRDSTRALVAFLDAVSALEWLDVQAIRSGDDGVKKVFFLNLFHLVQVHASVLGFLPKSKLQWSKFFNGVSYRVGGLVVSLAEIEHCVLRAPMAALRLPIAFLVLPRWHEPDERLGLELTAPDFRLNFALNCMTKSCWSAVVVYDAAHVDTQLDHVVRETVDLALTYDRESRVVYLPKACDWYRGDFVEASEAQSADRRQIAAATATASSSSGGSGSANVAMLELLVPYLRESKRELLEYVLAHHDTLVSKYKFTKYDYRFQEALREATTW